MPRFTQLSDWLTWLESLHPKAIDLGLSRVYEVAKRLSLLESPSPHSHEYSGRLVIANTQVVIVAGTNGKGSCIATMEQCLLAKDCRTGSYTSPHLHHYCERIRIDGEPVDETLVCQAFAAIDSARGDISLTYFEFGTLAALWIFVQQQVPYVLLEVGLGGRLDAVNIVDADIAVVTSIAVDHQEWLGDDREIIALEKLGVARSNIPVVIAESDLTESMKQFIREHPAPTKLIGQDFFFDINPSGSDGAQWHGEGGVLSMPIPSLPLPSVAAALQVVEVLGQLPEGSELTTIAHSLSLSGRFQKIAYEGCDLVFDVAHNPAAAAMLVERLSQDTEEYATTVAVFAVMGDKEISEIVTPFFDVVDRWYLGPLAMERAAPTEVVVELLASSKQSYCVEDSLPEALQAAVDSIQQRDSVSEHGRIIVFGSFFTVAAVQQAIGLTKG